MFDVTAAQFLRTHLEAEESPRRHAGVQTLCFTSAGEDRLAPDDVRFLERLRGGDGDSQEPRFCYRRTASGKAVVARIVPLRQTDRSGRSGRFLSHALVLRPEEFAKLGNDPFRLFATAEAFFDGNEQALASFRANPDGPARLSVPVATRADEASLAGCDPRQLAHLLMTARRAGELTASRKGVALDGGSLDAFALLRAVFSSLTPAARLACTFDTLVRRDEAATSSAWALASSAAPWERRHHRFSVTRRAFAAPPAFDPAWPAEKWLCDLAADPRVGDGDKVRLLLRADVADAIGDALSDADRDFTPECFGPVGASFVALNADRFGPAVDGHLDECLAGALEDELSRDVRRRMRAWLNAGATTQDRLRLWRDGPDGGRLAGWLAAVAEERGPAGLREHHLELGRFVERYAGDDAGAAHRKLHAFHCALVGDWRSLAEALKGQSYEESEAVQLACSRWWLPAVPQRGGPSVGHLPGEGVLIGCDLRQPDAGRAGRLAEALSVLTSVAVDDPWSPKQWKKRQGLLDGSSGQPIRWAKLDAELRGSRSARWVLQTHKAGLMFGVLFLPPNKHDVPLLEAFGASRQTRERAARDGAGLWARLFRFFGLGRNPPEGHPSRLDPLRLSVLLLVVRHLRAEPPG